ncbi:hypothetical protein SEA_MOLEFICENT_24 [Microbacterium phage Moleficent]|uniref:Uncharacterized protein n=6 Tax=Akonivirus TaxID=2842540 RepID=A0A6M3T3R3_9CAUD|nr:hypothetical protein HWD33_gp24 [Microbacterium phage Phedro]QFG04946.1 hypothetical protein SEA_PHRIEDRICE_24 [Microbacterium phage PhriedRice]QJD52876.1 hypothetical protein SEA_PHRACTURED_24 [Microbacterium phage Phractured]QJD52986.1 hypothetical protein SEA_PHARKY_24 [Microbacterium phage Pharky]QNL30326.1 hypothetical protein SEA_MAZUN_24 [Microbacterium phage Mazun]QPL14176.1 hypothetical protein SEA_ATRAXI_22 [Microbacterium phage Atraxi]QWY82716.1 hypothetical protein SEA_STAGEPHR
MARKNDTESTATAEVSEAAAATRAAVATRPRQSVVRFVQHFVTIRDTAPEELDRLFGDQQEALAEVADQVENPVQAAIEKVTAEQRDRSIKALENEDELNGYAAYVFDKETFEEKTREKKPRVKRTVAEKATDLLAEASDEDLAALREMLAARGL